MPSEVIPELLREVALFRDFSDEEIAEVLQVAEDREFDAERTIVHQGAQDRTLYIVLDGSVEVLLPAPTAQDTEISTMGPNGVIGEVSFFHASPHIATVRCVTPVIAVVLQRSAYDRLVGLESKAASKLASNAAEILAARLHQTDRVLCEMIQKHEDEEIATSLREFRRTLGVSHLSTSSTIHP